MVKSFTLDVDGKTYQVEAIRPGVLAIDGNVVQVEITEKGARIDDEAIAATLSEGFAIVSGKLYEIDWQTS